MVDIVFRDEHTALVPLQADQVGQFSGNNPAHQYLIGLNSDESRRVMSSYLNKVANFFSCDSLHVMPWQDLRREHLLAFRDRLKKESKAPATINTYLSAIRSVCRQAWLMNLMPADAFERIRQIGRAKGTRLLRGRRIHEKEIAELFKETRSDSSCRGVRDFAILATLVGGGLRRSEVVALNLEDVDWHEGAALVRGKGNRHRSQPFADAVIEALRIWVEEVRGDLPGALFTRIRRYDDVTMDRLTAQGIYFILSDRRLNTLVKKFTPHDIRRTYATSLLENGEDLILVSKLMGHAKLATTEIYDMRPEEAKKQVAKRITLPIK